MRRLFSRRRVRTGLLCCAVATILVPAGLAAAKHGGNDVDCSPSPNNCSGTAGNDDIRKGRNVNAQGGNDMVFPIPGSDLADFTGSTGNDYLEGTDGGFGDDLSGGPGGDFYSCAGRPCGLQGGGGIDIVEGGTGGDLLTGGGGSDSLSGDEDNDTIFADDGLRDTVSGGGGSDDCHVDSRDAVSNCE